MARLNPKKWFLPEMPDVLGLLRRQLALASEGADVFAEWAGGAPVNTATLREIEDRAEQAKRDLLDALRVAFITPLEPEDLFSISRGTGRMLNEMGDLVGEAEVLKCTPDEGISDMARLLAESVRQIEEAVAALGSSKKVATEAADRSIATVGLTQAHYYRGMAVTLNIEDRGGRIVQRELYRRCSRIGDTAVDVAERIVYSIVKQS